MSDESTTPDLVEMTHGIWVAVNRQDWDAVGSFFAPEAVFDMPMGLGTFEGPEGLRGLWEDWTSSYEELAYALEQVLDLGGGVVFVVVRAQGRATGSTGSVQMLWGWVYEWLDGMVTRVTIYLDIDAARAAAERLAESRG